MEPPYAPNVVNQTVDFNGITWKGNPGTGWTQVGYTGGGGGESNFANAFSAAAAATAAIPPIKLQPLSYYEGLALEELKPYYERILKEEGGDVEKAKVRLEEDYKLGLRRQTEDTQRTLTEQKDVTFPQEQQTLQETLVKRGLFNTPTVDGMATGGLPMQQQQKLVDDQKRRREAIERALGRYSETEGIRRGRTLEDVSSEWGRRQFALGQEKTEKAATIGRQKREDEYMQQQLDREAKLQQVNTQYG